MASGASTGVLEETRAELRPVELGVAWESPWREFRESVWDFFAGPRPLKDSELLEPLTLRVDWIRGRLPTKGLVGSVVWHVAVVTLLVLPIWGFLPAPEHTLAPVQIESTLYYIPPDLPNIELPRKATHAAASTAKPAVKESKLVARAGADELNPRQTILSVPVKVTHPRQTLIQPDAPQAPPKIAQQMPNIVQWAQTEPERPRLQLAPTATAPQMQKRTVRNMAAPVVANDKTAAPIDLAPNAPPDLKAPLEASNAKAEPRHARMADAAAPDVEAASGDANLHRIIALSATPAPPAPLVIVPNGNLAARIAISPEGTKTGTPGGAVHEASAADSARGTVAGGAGPNANGAGGSSSLPAAISVSGGIKPSSRRALNLNPAMPPPTYSRASRPTPAEVAKLDPSLPPEKILLGNEVYTMDVNMPNLTSVSGSWVLYFSQLDADQAPPFRPKGTLSRPVLTEKVDPKYSPDLINEHVDGEVVLYAIIRKNGTVDSIQVVHSVDPRLDRSAMDALARWKFTPGARDGVPVDLEAVIHIPFRFRPIER